MNNHSKTWLNEISFMRPVLLVFLVMYHAFAPYVGAWEMPEGIQDVEAYKWIALLSRSFRLEGFVFISGYIYTYQLVERHKFDSFRSLLDSKIQRLLIPCFFFSAIYLLWLERYEGFFKFCISLLGGVGHLWYLPCLFYCFLIQYYLVKKDIPVSRCLPVLVAMTIVSIIPLPINLNAPLYYMLFFYGGGIFWHYSKTISKKSTKENILISWSIFFLLFVTLNQMMDIFTSIIVETDSLVKKGALLCTNKFLKMILGWSGITALYLTACRFCTTHQIGRTIIKIGACGYGVYVFHQFILVYLYRHTEMPSLIGSCLLPWVGFLIALIISVILTLTVRSTHIGRKFL